MNPFTALKNLLFFFFNLSYKAFTSLYSAIHIYNSLPFTSLSFTFTFFRLHFPLLVFSFLTLILKICVSPLEVPIAPSGSFVPVSNGPIHKGEFSNVFSLFSGSDFPLMIDPTQAAWRL